MIPAVDRTLTERANGREIQVQIQSRAKVIENCNTKTDGRTAVYVAAIQLLSAIRALGHLPKRNSEQAPRLWGDDPDYCDTKLRSIPKQRSSSAKSRTVRRPQFLDRKNKSRSLESNGAGVRALRVARGFCLLRRPSESKDDEDALNWRIRNRCVYRHLVKPSKLVAGAQLDSA